jgi:general secretion pathway protein I
LIEVVVAFVLLTLVLATSFEIFSRGMARAGDLEDHSRALVIAQSKLAAAGMEEILKDGDAAGQSDDRRFQWTMSTRRYDDAASAASPAQPASAYAMYRVDVRVTWRGGDGRDHSLPLTTLAVGARP